MNEDIVLSQVDEKQRARKRKEHRRYYAKTAFRYKPRPWTDKEDDEVLSHEIPDSLLSPKIKRSMKAISNRRWRLRKEEQA